MAKVEMYPEGLHRKISKGKVVTLHHATYIVVDVDAVNTTVCNLATGEVSTYSVECLKFFEGKVVLSND